MPEMLKCDGYDEAIIGVASRFGQQDVIAYDYDKYIELLQKDGMTYEEAVEYFDFNVIGAWVGEGTPIFVEKMSVEEVFERGENMLED
jgi:hypothetical protein